MYTLYYAWSFFFVCKTPIATFFYVCRPVCHMDLSYVLCSSNLPELTHTPLIYIRLTHYTKFALFFWFLTYNFGGGYVYNYSRIGTAHFLRAGYSRIVHIQGLFPIQLLMLKYIMVELFVV